MPRIARNELLYDGCYAHIISRSIRKAKVINDRDDFLVFLNILKAAKQQSGFRLFHYCIMHTHFHLVVWMPGKATFSKAVQYIKTRYCFKYHAKYCSSGPIWRGRFRSLLIEDESYLRVCGEYVEYNPVRAGLVEEAKDWEFSSHRCYDGYSNNDLVDDYEDAATFGQMPSICLEDDKYFEGGIVIGSPYFQYQMKRKVKGI